MKSKKYVYGMVIGAIFLAGTFSGIGKTYMSASLKSEVVINAPVEVVFAWVTDNANVEKRLPYQTITGRHGSGLGAGYLYSFQNPMGKFKGEQVVVNYVPNQLWVEQTVTAMDGHGTYTWVFLGEGDQTRVIKTTQLSGRVPLYALLAGEKKLTELTQAAQDDELKLIKAEIEK